MCVEATLKWECWYICIKETHTRQSRARGYPPVQNQCLSVSTCQTQHSDEVLQSVWRTRNLRQAKKMGVTQVREDPSQRNLSIGSHTRWEGRTSWGLRCPQAASSDRSHIQSSQPSQEEVLTLFYRWKHCGSGRPSGSDAQGQKDGDRSKPRAPAGCFCKDVLSVTIIFRSFPGATWLHVDLLRSSLEFSCLTRRHRAAAKHISHIREATKGVKWTERASLW